MARTSGLASLYSINPNNDMIFSVFSWQRAVAACRTFRRCIGPRPDIAFNIELFLPPAYCNLLPLLRYPIQHLVVRPRERQKPGFAVIESQRRPGERNLGKWIIGLTIRDPFRHFLALPCRHGDAVSRISDGEVDSIHLSRMRHDVK